MQKTHTHKHKCSRRNINVCGVSSKNSCPIWCGLWFVKIQVSAFFFFKHIYLWIVYHCCVLVFSDYWEGKKPSLAWVKYLNTISFIYPQFPFFFSSFLTNNYLGVWFYFVHACMHAKLFQPCLTLCHPTDCTLPGFSVHGILQVRIWDWVAVPSSKGSSRPRNWTHVSYI